MLSGASFFFHDLTNQVWADGVSILLKGHNKGDPTDINIALYLFIFHSKNIVGLQLLVAIWKRQHIINSPEHEIHNPIKPGVEWSFRIDLGNYQHYEFNFLHEFIKI